MVALGSRSLAWMCWRVRRCTTGQNTLTQIGSAASRQPACGWARPSTRQCLNLASSLTAITLRLVDRRTKDGKAQWEAATEAAEAAGAELISNDDAQICMQIAGQVRSHPTARKVFSTGQAELSCFWTDEETGVLCKCRPDWLGMPLVVDLKSTEDASAEGFAKSAWQYRYWVQAAWYVDGIEQATGQRPDAFVFAAFEKSAPYASAFYFADDAMIQMGRAEYRRLLRVYADCLAAGRWPGYTTDVTPLGVPGWAMKAVNDNLPST